MHSSDCQFSKPRLWTFGFICACIGNFLLFFSFYLILPILPLYLIEVLHTPSSLVGLVLSGYILAALIIRPFSGFVLDTFDRRPIYWVAYLLFVFTFVGYPLAISLGLFLCVRVLHGFSFGLVTTAGNSLIVDIMPASRRGEGLGYFGVANNLAMAVGPMISLFMHGHYSFDAIFLVAVVGGIFGFIFVLFIPSKRVVEHGVKEPISFDRFFLLNGTRAGVCLMLVGIPYGILTTYVAIYGQQLGFKSGMGAFFSLMAVGLVGARLVSGKMVDRGKLVKVVMQGTLLCALAFFVLALLKLWAITPILVAFLFFMVALILGVGYGMLFPAYNTLFVNLAPNNRRATASSTYMTTWDVGVGLGLVTGGSLADSFGGLSFAFFVGSAASVVSLFLFFRYAGPHFEKMKLRS